MQITIKNPTVDYSALLKRWTPAAPAAPWYKEMALGSVLTGDRYIPVKRVFDVVVVSLLLVPILIVVALCAVAVWIESPGPIFFTQWRTGKYGRRFKMYKLRTMVANAEELKEKYAHLNVLTPPDFKIPDDPRVTRAGSLLRRTSLDELPQILNVLKGDMSLVGPRPTSFAAETYAPWQWERLAMEPGLTGLWQVVGRADLDFEDRCKLDVFYVRNRSLGLDLAVMFHTVGAVFSGRGAS